MAKDDPIPGVDNPPPALEGLTVDSMTEEAQKMQVLQEGDTIARTLSAEEQAAQDAAAEEARKAAEQAATESHEGETEEQKAAREEAEKAQREADAAEKAAKEAEQASDPGSKIKIPGAEDKTGEPKPAPDDAKKKRDEDLDKLAGQVDKTNRLPIRKVTENLRKAAQEARDRADAAAAEAARLKAENEELKNRPTELPKDVQDRLKVYEERSRELDITTDPDFRSKFDNVIKKNEDAIVEILKAGGADKREVYAVDSKGNVIRDQAGNPVIDHHEDDPDNLKSIVDRGLTIEKLGGMIKALEAAGRYGEAEKLRALVLKNGDLSEQRAAEIQTQRATIEAKRAQGVQTSDEQRKKMTNDVQTAVRAKVNEEFVKWGVKAPPRIEPGDPDTVKSSKQAKLDEYNKIVSDFGLAYQKAIASPVTAGSELAASLFVRNHVAPKLQKENADLAARITQLETELTAIKKAGSMSRLHAKISPDTRERGDGKPREMTLESLEADAKALGLQTG